MKKKIVIVISELYLGGTEKHLLNVLKRLSQYKNLDYRDTIAPLWNTLYDELDNLVSANKTADISTDDDEFVRRTYEVMLSNINSHHQAQVNVALCASIIQLGNYVKHMKNDSIHIPNTYTPDEINAANVLISLSRN